MKLFRRKRNKKGFTLSELLIGIGILSILFSIGTVGVTTYQKKLKLTEVDGIARQLFITVQNNITIAKETGQWEELEKKHKTMADLDAYFGPLMEKPSDYPTDTQWPESGKNSDHEYRYIVYDGTSEALTNTALSIMLPYGSIEEEVRSEGQYIIEYDYKTATVYGVFYTDSNETIRYSSDILGANGLNSTGGRSDSSDGKNVRRSYKNASGKSLIIGYYGGAIATTLTPIDLEETTVEVKNGNKLEVIVKDTNYNRVVDGVKIQSKLRITLTGEDSGNSAIRLLAYQDNVGTRNSESWWNATRNGDTITYQLTLDDITSRGGQFATLFPELWAGENIVISVEVFSNDVLSKPVKTVERTNSLFGAKYTNTTGSEPTNQITIYTVRHLQNLSPAVSHLFGDRNSTVMSAWGSLRAEQTQTLDWADFISDVGNNPTIYGYHEDKNLQQPLAINQFYSIDNQVIIAYEGHNHTIKNLSIKEDSSGHAGIFSNIGGVAKHMVIKDLVLDSITTINHSDNDSVHTGTLIGGVGWTLSLTVENITAINSTVAVDKGDAGSIIGYVESGSDGNVTINNLVSINPTVTMYGGNAGGLIGFMSKGRVTNSSVYLTDTTITTSDGTTTTYKASEKYEKGAYNLADRTIGGESIDTERMTLQYQVYSRYGLAGGFIGQVDGTTITDCFTAIPVITKNGVAGGFIAKTASYGDTKNITISNSYVGGYTKDGEYSDYQNVVSTNGTAGGFIGETSNNGTTTVTNSYSTASVYAAKVGGFTGEVKAGNTIYRNSYMTGKITCASTSSNSSEAGSGGVVGVIQSGSISVENSYYLKDSNKDTNFTTVINNEQSIGYEDLKTVFGTDTEGKETHNYDGFFSEEETKAEYPFKMVTKTGAINKNNKAHYGDWPIPQPTTEYDAGLLYYEVVNGQIYYHGYLAKYVTNDSNIDRETYKEIFTESDETLQNGLVTGSGKYVTEDGYLLVLPKDSNPLNYLVSIGDGKIYASDKGTLNNYTEKFDKNRFNSERFLQLEEYDLYYFTKEDNAYARTYLTLGEAKSDGSFGKYASFSFYPKFADTIFKVAANGENYSPDDKTYYIRSARQLSNMQNSTYVKDSGVASDITLKQTLDISYENVSFTRNGANTSYSYNTVWNLWADYIAEKDSGNKGYVIKGLDRVFLYTIESNAVVQGVTLLNSKIDSYVFTVAGFAMYNKGTIDSCGIRSEYANSDGYNQVQVKGTGNVAGFVYENSWEQGVIKNSYFVGTVSGQNASGFIFNNHQTVENSYANAIVTADYTASGFVDYVNHGKTVKNSFSVGKVTSNYGTAYGFLRYANSPYNISNNYSALFGLSGSWIVLFGEGDYGFNDSWWLESAWLKGNIKTYSERGNKITYDELSAKGTNLIPHKYNSGNENIDTEKGTYPFPVTTGFGAYTSLEFFGDWPKKSEVINAEATDVGVVYYEIIDGKLYYHGFIGEFSANNSSPNYKEIYTEGENLEKGLVKESGKYVTEDGYLIIIPEGTDTSKIAVATGSQAPSGGERYTLAQCTESFYWSDQFKVEGYDTYYFAKDVSTYASTYIAIGENTNPDYPEFGNYVTFTFDLYFADSVGTKLEDNHPYYIRSTRHLARLVDSAWTIVNNANVRLIQSLDISYEDVTVTKNGKETSYEYQTALMLSADYTSIKSTDKENSSYVIKGLDKTLFGSIEQAAEVRGVTLVNSKVNGAAAFTHTNKGIIDSCSVRSDSPAIDGYEKVQIQVNDSAGFVKENQGGTIRNSYIVGTITGYNASGFVYSNQGNIENCYANVIIEGTGTVSGFIHGNNGGTIKNSFVVGKVSSKDGTANGFMSYQYNNGSSMENCYTALFGLSGSQVFLFGSGQGDRYTNCGWLDTPWVEGEIQQGDPNNMKAQGTAMSYEEMEAKGTNVVTYKFESSYENIDTSNTVYPVYPFEVLTADNAYHALDFWGDWPKKAEIVSTHIGLIYYEIVDGAYYYNGYVSEVNPDGTNKEVVQISTKGYESSNGFLEESGKYVSEEGYMILLSKDASMNGISLQYNGKNTVNIEEENKVNSEISGLEDFTAYYVD